MLGLGVGCGCWLWVLALDIGGRCGHSTNCHTERSCISQDIPSVLTAMYHDMP